MDVSTDILATTIGFASFKRGHGALVLINSITDVDGKTTDIVFGTDALRGLCTSLSDKEKYLKLISMAIDDHSFSLALNDLILATTMPRHAAVNCARAMEGIRNLIAGESTDEKAAWPIMREALNVDRTFVQFIWELATDYRHGKRSKKQNPFDVYQSIRRTWILMDRYFHLRLRKAERLPRSEFPYLSG